MKVLVACECSGVVRDAFLARGHDAISCDLKPTRSPGPHYKGDIFDIIEYPFDLMIAHPECTHLACSGSKHFADKRFDGRQQVAIAFVMKLKRLSAHIPLRCIEQPKSILSTNWRKRDQAIQPHQFGHPEFKETWLWLDGLPHLQPTNQLAVPARNTEEWIKWNKVHRMTPSEDRAEKRSVTYAGIAAAMAEQWGSL